MKNISSFIPEHSCIPDNSQRVQALNPKKSFIVQAPAGSGKTEILTQRFLALLSHVKQPEEILAITFTKKSAAEMRTRIINALKFAALEPEPSLPHAKTTWQLAKNALEQNDNLEWNLLDNPNRLRIQTIDSLNVQLTKQLPILSHFGVTPDITNDPVALYREAVQEFLSHLEENVSWSDAIAQLLKHMDNDLNKVELLLINMLAKRDQWLPYITPNANEPDLRHKLEKQLQAVVIDLLFCVTNTFPKEHIGELLSLADYAAYHLNQANIDSSIRHCANLKTLPGIHSTDINKWQALSQLLLNKEHQWRKTFDKRQGFPAPSQAINAEEKQAMTDMKQRMSILVNQLIKHESLRMAFIELQLAPSIYYDDVQWETLEALHQALQIVVAQLYLTFQKHSQIDYIESAQAALTALGTEDAPTDLTLFLDYQLQHILIDEFQDTSHTQFRLIEKLTTGWNNQDGRTLFVVGDPMQSIYRFREAEVGLFIQVRTHGLGEIKLQPLTLSVNFRSTHTIVNWVNTHFQYVLPPFEDIATGAVTYSPSIANQNTINSEPHPEISSSVTLHPFMEKNENKQAAAIIDLILKTKNTAPTDTIAILVRSRSHLEQIIPALKKANISYRAIDIDPLMTKAVIQDLLVLTRALLHPSDRVAWLALLRAPWCGLDLKDLQRLSGNNPSISLYEQLLSSTAITQLSEDGQKRIQRILPIILKKIDDRYRYSKRLWIESTWLLLGGSACLTEPSDLEDAAVFFNLLESMDQTGTSLDIEILHNKVQQLYASADNQADNSLQLMTIHNAKGLEFDTVILPHLERRSPNDDKQLLLWMEHPLQYNHNELLSKTALVIAPIQAVGRASDPIYDYIKRQHATKTEYENGRLLYVAATRAKKRLHLFFSLEKNDKNDIIKPATSSLLGKLWHSILPILPEIPAVSSPTIDLNNENKRYLPRLALTWKNPINERLEKITFHNETSGFRLINNTSQIVGTFIHRLLQQLSQQGKTAWENLHTSLKKQYIQRHLLQSGVRAEEILEATEKVMLAIENTLIDPRGQWIIQNHLDAKSELQLTIVIDNMIQSLVIDRTFVDENNVRWIIDYKTTHHNNLHLETFMTTEKEKYFQKMLNYAEAIRKIDTRPIKYGLYFPLLPAWHEWN